MVIPSPGVRMPTMRSPGTAPPLGAKRTGMSQSTPRSGSAAPFSPLPGTRNTRLAALARPNQPALARRQRRPGFALLLEIGIDRAHHVGRIEFAAPDADEHVVDRAARQARQRALQLGVGELAPRAREGALDDLAPEAAVLRLGRLAGGAADRGAGPPGHDEAVPGRRRRAAVGAGDQHFVAVAQAARSAARCGR